MTKEEIREEIDYCVRYADYDDNDEIKVEALVAKILGTLHSQGVVLKVEGELPLPKFENSIVGVADFQLQIKAQQDMKDAGYTATEDLI